MMATEVSIDKVKKFRNKFKSAISTKTRKTKAELGLEMTLDARDRGVPFQFGNGVIAI